MTDYADTTLLIEALHGWAAIRERTAKRGASEIDTARRAGDDIRSASVKVARLLAEAAALERTADALLSGQLLPPAPPTPPTPAEQATDTPQTTPRRRGKGKAPATPPTPAEAPSAAAEAPQPVDLDAAIRKAAQKAGVVVAADDPFTGAAAEDEPTQAEIDNLLNEETP